MKQSSRYRLLLPVRVLPLALLLAATTPQAVVAQQLREGVAGQQQGVRTVSDRETCLKVLARNGGASSVPANGAAYTPGVDVNGRPVVAADGGSGEDTSWLTESITVVLSVDLAKKYGLGQNGKMFGADVPLGQVTYRGGQVFVNGQPLMGDDQQALRDACLRLESSSQRGR